MYGVPLRPLPLFLGIFAGCADLAVPVADGRCGNRVVEPASGEECDGAADGDARCGEPTTSAACRFVCAPLAAASCPAGFSCGGDGVCRYPEGRFRAAYELSGFFARPERLEAVDTDGDRRLDLVGVDPAAIEVRHGEPGGRFASPATFDLDGSGGRGAFADLDLDGRTDLALPQSAGVLLTRGRAARDLAPLAYPLVDEIVLESLTVSSFFATEYYEDTLVLGVVDGDPFLYILGSSSPEWWEFDELLAGPPALPPVVGIGDANVLTGAEEIALSLVGSERVLVLGVRCDEDDDEFPCEIGVRSRVALPGRVSEGTRFVDADGDRALDLLVSVSTPDGPRVALAYGNGRGGFTSESGAPDTAELAPAFDPMRFCLGDACRPSERWPLAAGDFDDDGVDDYVASTGVWLTTSADPLAVDLAWAAEGRHAWTEAAVGDFNFDGYLDVATVNAREAAVVFLIGAGAGAFHRFRVATPDVPREIRVGDFDGDLFDDLAYVEGDERVVVLFGDPSGGPDRRVPMAELPGVVRLSPTTESTDPDITGDLIVVTATGTGTARRHQLTQLHGNSQRQMLAPLVFDGEPRLVEVGRFFRGAEDPRQLLVFAIGYGAQPGDAAPLRAFLATQILDTPRVAVERLPFDRTCAELALDPFCLISKRIDLDRDGLDELVISGDDLGCEFARASPGPPVVVSVADDRSLRCQVLTPALGPRRVSRFVVGDVNLDDVPDLLIGYGGIGPRIELHLGRPGRSAPELVGLPVPAPPSIGRVFGFDLVATAPGAPTLALLTAEGLFAGPVGSGPLAPPTPVAAFEVRERDRAVVRTGDFDADGLEDVLVVGGEGLRLFTQAECTADGADLGRCARRAP